MVCQTILNAQGKAMKPIDVVKAYLNAWNHHDAQAIVALFADGGTYSDPTTAGRISGQALGLMAEELWKAFPDVAFELTIDPARRSMNLFAFFASNVVWTKKTRDTKPWCSCTNGASRWCACTSEAPRS